MAKKYANIKDIWLVHLLCACLRPSFCWHLLRLPTKGWSGWVDLGGWLHTEMVYRQSMVAHPSTNRAWRWLTSLMWPTTAPNKLNRRTTWGVKEAENLRVFFRWDKTSSGSLRPPDTSKKTQWVSREKPTQSSIQLQFLFSAI